LYQVFIIKENFISSCTKLKSVKFVVEALSCFSESPCFTEYNVTHHR